MTTIAGAELDLDRDLPSAAKEIWYSPCGVPTAFVIALATGRFEEEFAGTGLAWRQLTDSSDPAVHQSHYTHRQANSVRHGGNIPAIWARSRGADTRVIGISWRRHPYPVLVLPGSGIETADDLAGRRLLVLRTREVAVDWWRAATMRVYEAALASAGLTLADVELVEVVRGSQPLGGTETASGAGRQRRALQGRYRLTRALLEPLVRGEVDAVVAQATVAEELLGLTGAFVVFDQGDQADRLRRTNNSAPDVLTVSGRFAEEHPDRVARVIARLLDSAAWARAHPDEARALFAAHLQAPVSLLDLAFGSDLPARLDVGLPDYTVEVLQAQHDSLLSHGFIERPFDIEAWIDRRPLQLARASRVESNGRNGIGPVAASTPSVTANQRSA